MRYALVTGGSRGIGRAICISLAKDAFHVIINYNSNSSEAEATLAMVRENGGSGEIMQFDVSSQEAVEKALGGWQAGN